MILSGTKILTGDGKMLVMVVGPLSCVGRVNMYLEDESGATPLQMKLEKVARDIGKFGLYSAIMIVVVLLIRFAIERAQQGYWQTSVHLPEIVNFFILGITVVVVAIPEGLPLAVTLSLA